MNNDNNFNYLNLSELINLCDFQKLQDELARPLKMSLIAVDYTGKPLTEHSCCSEFCKLVRSIPKYKKLCEKCDSYGGLEAARSKHTYIYACHMGIIDFAVPIFYKDYYLGAIMCGQVLLDKPYENYNIKTVVAENSKDEIPLFDTKNFYGKLSKINFEQLKDYSDLIYYISNYAFSSVMNLKKPIPAVSEENLIPEQISEDKATDNSENEQSNDIKYIPSAIDPAIRYVNSNYSKTINTELLASLCNISSSYFSKLFRKVMRQGITEYVNKVRVEAAKNLLVTTRLTIISIAFECGFEDSGYFIKVFKKFTGLTPNQYRITNSKIELFNSSL